MPTYILVPRPGGAFAGSLVAAAQAGTPRERGRDTRQILKSILDVLPSGRYAGRGLATADGITGENGVLPGPPMPLTPDPTSAIQQRLPRGLEALGIALADDLDAGELAALRAEGVDVVEDMTIPLVAPVTGQATTSSTSPPTNPWHLSQLNVAAARSQSLLGQGLRIGILDTGIDATHPEFTGKSIAFMEFDARGYKISGTARDAQSHGTHVSGLAAGNNVGVAPGANLAVAAVLTTTTLQGMSGQLAQILAGVNWLLQSNFGTGGAVDEAVILNASLGGSGYDSYLYNVLSAAQLVPGAQLVAAIGNSAKRSTDPVPVVDRHGSPGNYDIVLGVGATDVNDDVAPFSDWGSVSQHAGITKPDLVAPGVDVVSSVPGGLWATASGTSMASPIVAGAGCLLIEKYPALRRNPANLRTRLTQLVVTANPAARAGRGRLDLTNI